jgi:hypothetical protein
VTAPIVSNMAIARYTTLVVSVPAVPACIIAAHTDT